MKRVQISAETEAMCDFAIEQIQGGKGRSVRVTFAEALDWLLRDACEYGSPIVGAQARQTWPDSAETKNWERVRG